MYEIRCTPARHGAEVWGTLSPVTWKSRRPKPGSDAARRRIVVTLPLIIFASLLCPDVAPHEAVAGHGGVVQLNRAGAGPFVVSVWTQPSPPTAGPWRVDVAVMGEKGVAAPDTAG